MITVTEAISFEWQMNLDMGSLDWRYIGDQNQRIVACLTILNYAVLNIMRIQA
jgi:hypothetical protein